MPDYGGKQKNLMRTDISMYAYLKESVQNSDEIKVVYRDTKISAKELIADIDAVSAFLLSEGVKCGDSIAVCLPNIPQAIAAFYAINKLGAVVNAIHPRLRGDALISALKKTNTKIIFLYDLLIPKHIKALRENGIKVVACAYADYLKGVKRLYKVPFIACGKDIVPFRKTLKYSGGEEFFADGENDAVYLHSSGTSGQSKTVRLSSRAFNALSEGLCEMIEEKVGYKLRPDDEMLMTLPVFHGFGLGVCVHFSLHRFRVVMAPFFKARDVAGIIRRNKIRFMVAVPNMLRRLAAEKRTDNKALSSVKLVFSGGDKLSDAIRDDFNALLKRNGSDCVVMEGYGLSELTSVVSINIHPEKNKSQGLPLPGVDVKILSIPDGKELSAGETGEICIASKCVMNGYFDAEAKFSEIGGKMYFHTGDVGHLDEEGFIYLRDRIKRIAIIGGVNIYPQEVEDVITGVAGVKAACVARYTDTDGRTRTKAFIELEKGLSLNARMKNTIREMVENKVIKYASPTLFEQVDELRRNKMGKIDYLYYEDMLKG